MDFVEICNVCARKLIIKVDKRIFNSDKICCNYYDFYFGVTFWNTLYIGITDTATTTSSIAAAGSTGIIVVQVEFVHQI